MISYFTLCLWLVPFALFVSLSANENILPTVAETKPLLGKIFIYFNFLKQNKSLNSNDKYNLNTIPNKKFTNNIFKNVL